MSTFFPHVHLPALREFATATAAAEHPPRSVMRSGKKVPVRTRPKIVACEDVEWGGERMILITFDPSSMPLGPECMLAHFPQGRPRIVTQALVGMTSTIRRYPLPIGAPKIYAYKDITPNEVGAEVVLLEKAPGESLDTLWPRLDNRQEMQVAVRIAELLLALFNYRGESICTDLEGTDVNTRRPGIGQPLAESSSQQPVLLSPPFDQEPLQTMPPPAAMCSTEAYLRALAHRVSRVFNNPAANQAARNTGFPDDPPLTDLDVQRIRETWKRLAYLIPYHTGGFYLPDNLSIAARRSAYSVLQSKAFGIVHGDMRMSRFVVYFKPESPLPSSSTSRSLAENTAVLTLTGWEHAHRAPLWSCAQMPPWLHPHISLTEVIPWERQRYFRMLILLLMCDPKLLSNSWEWVVAYVYGTTERWFEGCLSSPWIFRDTIELLLVRLKAYWRVAKPGTEFPLVVGKEYAEIAPGNETPNKGKATISG